MKAYRLAAIVLLVLTANPVLGVRRRSGEYLVKPHDTGSEICERYHLTLSEFARLNPNVDINTLRAGERVRVTDASDSSPVTRMTRTSERSRLVEPDVTVQPDVAQVDKTAVEERPAKPAPDVAAAAAVDKPAAAVKKPIVKETAKPKSGGYLSNYYNEPAKRANKGEPSVAASLLRVAGALVFVVALAVLSLYALKHFGSGKITRKSPRRSIKIIETTGLGPNRALHVVQAGSKYLLVGSTPNQISLVAELDAAEAEADPEKAVDFASILHKSGTAQDRADSASKLSDTLRDGASFLQKKTSAARAMRAKAEIDES